MTINELLAHDEKFRYQMLDRMKTDCEYYLGNGHRHNKFLWANDEAKQIEYMKALWNSFPQDKKPEWLTYEQICKYEKSFQIELIKEDCNDRGQVTYEEWSDGSWTKYEYDEQGRNIYTETNTGKWEKKEYDLYGKQTYYENDIGYWYKQNYDKNGNLVYCENSEGYWEKREYEDGKLIYQEDSTGFINGTPKEIAQELEEDEPDICE